MSAERIRDAGDGGEDWGAGEIRRALGRLEGAVNALSDKVVVQAVYEVEQREQDNQIRQIVLRLAEDRAEYRNALVKENAEREAWQASMVGRIWWLVALGVSSLIGTLGMVASIWGTLHN